MESFQENLNVVIELSSHWSKNVSKINSHILFNFFFNERRSKKILNHLNNFINRLELTKPDEVGTFQM